jgi:hypothetical protein
MTVRGPKDRAGRAGDRPRSLEPVEAFTIAVEPDADGVPPLSRVRSAFTVPFRVQ